MGYVGWVENVVDSSRFDRIDWGLWPSFKNEEGSCIVILRILTSGGLCRVGWKCCRFDSIRSNRHESFPLLSIRHAGSRFARRYSVRIESRRNMRIESNRKVLQTNRLSLGVLDMDEALTTVIHAKKESIQIISTLEYLLQTVLLKFYWSCHGRYWPKLALFDYKCITIASTLFPKWMSLMFTKRGIN